MDIFKQNYQSVVNRGLITPETTNQDFYNKLIEEVSEVYNEIPPLGSGVDYLHEEIADVITVCANWLIHNGQEPEYWLKKVLEKNQKREIK